MKITALLENTTQRDGMETEHGLSLYIETKKHRILFDMGQSDLFAKNAEKLGIDLSKVDLAVLSHGHYDHGGGLRKFLEINATAPVYIHKDAFLPHYNGREKYIGLDVTLQNHPRIRFTHEDFSLGEGLTLYAGNDRKSTYPPFPSGLCERVGDAFVEEDFRHEQYLMLEEEGFRVLLSGCSHRGIRNGAEEFRADVIVGGFHTSKLPDGELLTETAKGLSALPTVFYTCHCTGREQYGFLRRTMENLRYLSCGETVLLP